MSLFVAFYRKKFWPAPLNGTKNPLPDGPIETKKKQCYFQGTTCKTGTDTGASYFPEPSSILKQKCRQNPMKKKTILDKFG